MLLSLFWVSGLEARERQVVAVLPVKVLYPAQGKQWLGYFLQDELSRQFQLQKHFTALSPGEVNRWFQDEDAEEKQLQSFQQSVKPHWILEHEGQTSKEYMKEEWRRLTPDIDKILKEIMEQTNETNTDTPE